MSTLNNFKHLDIDWDMTPEDAVVLYLEWGNNCWHAKHMPIRSKEDYTNYFVVYTWDKVPRAILVRRNSEEAKELWEKNLPTELGKNFLASVGNLKGVYTPNEPVREWLEKELLEKTPEKGLKELQEENISCAL